MTDWQRFWFLVYFIQFLLVLFICSSFKKYNTVLFNAKASQSYLRYGTGLACTNNLLFMYAHHAYTPSTHNLKAILFVTYLDQGSSHNPLQTFQMFMYTATKVCTVMFRDKDPSSNKHPLQKQ